MRLDVINKQWLSNGFGKTWLSIIFFLLVASTKGQQTYEKLPYCSESSVPGLLLVSTIDGKFSALNSEGELQWQVDTGPGPLLTSNIHNIELTNSGKWIRIIPSLTGSLYRFDGDSLDPIPISAESLLRSSFKYSDDLVISGGVEIRTYGIGFRTGKIFYTCSSLKCTNNSNSESEVDDILILERNTQTVRAVETQSGYERWNFSVGYHNIKLSQISCSDPLANLFNWNVTAVIPDGILLASRHQDNAQTTWQYHFPSPIVRVWKWNGHKITEIDLFQIRTDDPNETQISPAVYIGMHKKQLYIHELYNLHYKTEAGTGIAESNSLAKIPWKPISASGLLTEDDSTAMSVLYSSEYVNGRGYYLYSENDIKQKKNGLCKNNKTIRFPMLTQNSDPINIGLLFSQWWKELVVILLTTAFLFRLMMKSLIRHQQNQRIIFVERKVEVPSRSNSSSDRISESSDTIFSSRFLNDFDMLRCLGKGGFGVVFEVKQKIDECHYAIKRIVLPNEESKRDAVMREVKALAKLEHHNIVRYFNSWVEKPPYGWQQEHDNEWLRDTSEFTTDTTNNQNASSYVSHLNSNNRYITNHTTEADSFIVFEKSSKQSKSSPTTSSRSNRTETITFDELCPLEEVSCEHDQRSCSLKEVKITDKPPVYLYIQMQLCQKHSLKEWLIENKNRNFTVILDIFKQILSAVEYVHMQGLIHRDLKPSNIFFSLDGQIKVGDFGLVKDEEESYDIQNMSSASKDHTKAVGTRLYMSPEQVNGRNYNYKVDIYSLGLIFFELLVYFSTDMERINTLTKLRENHFPNDFIQQYTDEYNLLTKMLCHLPEKRLTTFGIRARPPLNNCDNDYNAMYDFELPKFNRSTGQTTLKS